MNRAEGIDGAAGQVFNVASFRDIGLDGEHGSILPCEGGLGFAERHLVHVGEDNAHTGARASLGDSAADAAGGTCNDGDSSLKVFHCILLRCRALYSRNAC
jgi:hypothetical protein